jgi:hypothetical protein
MWNEREKPLCGVSAPQIFQYFKEYKAEVVRYNMLKSVGEAAGLGSPTSILPLTRVSLKATTEATQ